MLIQILSYFEDDTLVKSINDSDVSFVVKAKG